jgi:hypothetical protein
MSSPRTPFFERALPTEKQAASSGLLRSSLVPAGYGHTATGCGKSNQPLVARNAIFRIGQKQPDSIKCLLDQQAFAQVGQMDEGDPLGPGGYDREECMPWGGGISSP